MKIETTHYSYALYRHDGFEFVFTDANALGRELWRAGKGKYTHYKTVKVTVGAELIRQDTVGTTKITYK